jgi:hypothetical protein
LDESNISIRTSELHEIWSHEEYSSENVKFKVGKMEW